MCDFFSFVGDGYGNYLYSDWEYRKNHLSEDYDSHTHILTVSKVPPYMQDRWSKYEYNPLTKKFTIDEPVDGHDHEAAENWVISLNFKRIVEPLVIKPIVNPTQIKKRKPTQEDIENLMQWASVGASIRDSVRDSVWTSVGASVGASARDSARDSIWTSVGASVRDSIWTSVGASVGASAMVSAMASVRDSVWVYISSFFDIKYDCDLSPCIRLWEHGLVPSFDGKTWRLHSGRNMEVVYEWKKSNE